MSHNRRDVNVGNSEVAPGMGRTGRRPAYHYIQTYRAKFPERRKAYRVVGKALKSGRLTRPSACQKCRAVCRPHAHHADYAKPLQVRWLCWPCHRSHHVTQRRKAA